MKKFSFILVLVLVFPLMACSKEKNLPVNNTTQPAQEANTSLNKDDENALEETPSSEDGPDYEAKPKSLVSDDNSKDTTSTEKLLEKPIEEKNLVEVDIMDPENEYRSVPLPPRKGWG